MSERDPGPPEPLPTEGGPLRRSVGRQPVAYNEGVPVFSLAFAAVISFVALCIAPAWLHPMLATLVPEGQNVGPLALPLFANSYLEALGVSALLTAIGLVLVSVERFRLYPPWLPLALSFPVAWALILPSALVQGGPWLSWLAFGCIVASVFCVYWTVLNWARGVWD
ncbi:MAG: hypothetical protein U0790_02910 [Isosphaeraceae bacterium]